MSKRFVDVVYHITDMQAAITSMLTNHPELMKFTKDEDGNDVAPDGWDSFNYVGGKAPGVELYLGRFTREVYLQLINDTPTGFEILASGFPIDQIQQMLRERIFTYLEDKLLEDGTTEIIEYVWSEGDEEEIRILPTQQSCDKYQSLFPEELSYFDGETTQTISGRIGFCNLGLA